MRCTALTKSAGKYVFVPGQTLDLPADEAQMLAEANAVRIEEAKKPVRRQKRAKPKSEDQE